MQTLLPVPQARAVLTRLGALTDAELAALDAEVEEARVALENLEAIRRVAYVSQADRLGLGAEPEPPPPVVKQIEARPRKALPALKANYPEDRKKPNGSPVDRNRLKLAQTLFEHGPLSSGHLAERSGVPRNGPFSVAALTRDHAWFEQDNGWIRLTTLGHQLAKERAEGGNS